MFKKNSSQIIWRRNLDIPRWLQVFFLFHFLEFVVNSFLRFFSEEKKIKWHLLASCLGFPNIGANLELVHQIKGFLNGEILQETLDYFYQKNFESAVKWTAR